MAAEHDRRRQAGASTQQAMPEGQGAAGYAVAVASAAAAQAGNEQWRMHVQAPDWSLRTRQDQQTHARSRRVLSALLAGLAAVLAVLVLTISGTPAGTEGQGPAGGPTGAPGAGLLTPDPSAIPSPSAPPANASPEPTATASAAATATATATASAGAGLVDGDQPTTQQRSYDLELARVIALSLLALLAILSAVALLAPRRDPLVFSVTVGGASEPRPQPGADGGTTTTAADSAERPSPTGSKKDTSLMAGEPVVAQALVTIVLLAAGVLGINYTSGLEENLLNIAVPLVPLLGAFFARSRVTPLPRTTPS